MSSRLAQALVLAATVIVIVLVVFPLLFGPAVENPSARFPDNPFSLEIKISNQNLTPFTNLEYTCEAGELELASGVRITDAQVVNRGRIRRFSGRRAIAVRCETAYIINAPIKRAELKLTLQYRAFPWPQERVREYDFVAEVDAGGHVTGWKRR